MLGHALIHDLSLLSLHSGKGVIHYSRQGMIESSYTPQEDTVLSLCNTHKEGVFTGRECSVLFYSYSLPPVSFNEKR